MESIQDLHLQLATVIVLAAEMVRVLICPTICSSMITLSDGSYGMPHDTNDEETPRGFSETLSEGVLWETGGNKIELHSICSYTVCLSLPHYE